MRDRERNVPTASNMFYNKKIVIPLREKAWPKRHAKDNATAGSQILVL
jgi:hypothetical protein